MADVLVDKARAFIEESRDRPFFLYFFAGHSRAAHPIPASGAGASFQLPRGRDGSTGLGGGRDSRSHRAAGIGQRHPVIFSSDNGPVYDDGYQDGTTVHTSTAEVDRGHDASGCYRGGKYQIYEGGTRIPLIVRWPGRVAPESQEALLTQVDFLASFARMLGQEIPDGRRATAGTALARFWARRPAWSAFILEQGRGLAVRRGPWKYIEPLPP